jgi:hypothetical protein
MISPPLRHRRHIWPGAIRRDYDDYFKAYSTAMMASRSERANLVHGGKSTSPLCAAERGVSSRPRS